MELSDGKITNPFDLLEKIDKEAQQRRLQQSADVKEKDLKRYLELQVGDTYLLIQVEDVEELFTFSNIVPVPGAKPWMLGLVNIRGSLVAVTDLLSFFKKEIPRKHLSDRILVINNANDRFGLLVTKVLGMRQIEKSQLSPVERSGELIEYFAQNEVRIGQDKHLILDINLLVNNNRFQMAASLR